MVPEVHSRDRSESCSGETILGSLPIDYVPDGGEVLCFAVLILQVVLR